MPVLLYYADQADVAHDRRTRRWFATLGEASAAADILPVPSTVYDLQTDAGVSIPAAYRDLYERTTDPDDQPVVHSWATQDWSRWHQVPVSAHGSQAYTASVVGRRGRITSTAGTDGNHRTWFLREGTRWPDSEIVSLWWPPSIFTPAGAPLLTRPQQGHVHGAYVGDDGRLRGAAVWVNIFGANPSAESLVVNMAEADGTTLWLGAGGNAGATNAVGRTALVLHANRFDFGGGLLDLRVSPHWAADSIVASSTGDLASMAATGLNGSYTVQGGAEHQGLIRLTSAESSALTDATAGGTWTPAYPWRVMPYWVRSRYVPPRMMVKQWAYGRAEPDWGGPHTWVVDLATDADTVEVPNKPGLCGVWAAHAHSSAWIELGDWRASRAAA